MGLWYFFLAPGVPTGALIGRGHGMGQEPASRQPAPLSGLGRLALWLRLALRLGLGWLDFLIWLDLAWISAGFSLISASA